MGKLFDVALEWLKTGVIPSSIVTMAITGHALLILPITQNLMLYLMLEKKQSCFMCMFISQSMYHKKIGWT